MSNDSLIESLLDGSHGMWIRWLKQKSRSQNMRENNKFFGKNVFYIEADIDCFKCGLTWTMNFESDWIIDTINLGENWKAFISSKYDKFEQFMGSGEKLCGQHFCEKCKLTFFECDDCNNKTSVVDVDTWFIDTDFYVGDISDRCHPRKHTAANLCEDFRVFQGNGLIVCERCYKRGKWGIGKWNENEGHIDCDFCDMVLCYDCHDRIHYNK